MGVYIKGMEMPTSCEKCPFLDYEEGFCFASGVKHESGWYESTLWPGGIKDGRHEDCPLVPVPPHGDLIDRREAIIDANERAYDFWNCDADVDSTVSFLNEQPTIIPAEEGET